MNKLIITAMLAVLSAGCAVIGGGQKPTDPVQGKSWTVWGSTEKWAFNNADRICPYGYFVHDERPNRLLPPLYLMEIECKTEGSGQVDMVLRPVVPKPYNPDGIGEVGAYSYQIERMAAVRSCNSKPLALVASKSAGIETYTVECENGAEVRVQCGLTKCEVIRR